MKRILGFEMIANIAFWVVFIGVVVFTLGFGSSLYIAREEISKEMDQKIDSDISYVLSYVDGQLQRVEDVAYTLLSSKFGKIIRTIDGKNVVTIDPKDFLPISEEEVFQLLEHFLDANPFICGIAVGIETDVSFKTKGKYGFAAYVTNLSGKKERLKLGDIHDFHQREWYKSTINTDVAYWSKPYREISRGKVVTSFLIPFHGTDNQELGVVALDIDTEAFQQKCLEATPFPNAEVTLVDREFRFICHPDTTSLLKKISEVKEFRDYRFIDSLKIDINHEIEGKYIVENSSNDKAFFYFERLKRTGWILGIQCPVKDVYGSVDRMKSITTWISIISIFFMTVCFIWLFRKLLKVTQTKAGIERDLTIASTLQMSLIPKQYPAFPLRKDLDICGFIQPAKSVGGDLYDYFIREDHFYFCIGDVSGKGIPASLYMSMVCALFRNVSLYVKTPEAIADAINKGLSEGNNMNMFCSMFIGVLDLKTGLLEYCNAGHNAPVIRRLTDKGVDVHFMDLQSNIAVGILEGFEFQSSTTILKPGEALFLYTDGVTEAKNVKNEYYGEEALLDVLTQVRIQKQSSSRDLVETVFRSVSQFSKGMEQNDDITILWVEYKGNDDNDTERRICDEN